MIHAHERFVRSKRAHFGQPRERSRTRSAISPMLARTDKVNRSMSSEVKLEAIVRIQRSDLLSRTRAFYSSAAIKSQRVKIWLLSFRHRSSRKLQKTNYFSLFIWEVFLNCLRIFKTWNRSNFACWRIELLFCVRETWNLKHTNGKGTSLCILERVWNSFCEVSDVSEGTIALIDKPVFTKKNMQKYRPIS